MQGAHDQATRAAARKRVIRSAVGIGLATGAYALSFGAISVAAGLSVVQTSALSLLMLTGASQFALVGVLSGGGGAIAAAATSALLGTRNGLYGFRLASLLQARGPRRLLAAHLVIDESTAMAIGQDSAEAGRLGFWATGTSVFVLWNAGTLTGALAARALSDPRSLGLDAAVPAAFLALLAPRLRRGEPPGFRVVAAGVALAAVPVVPAGVAVLVAGVVALIAGITGRAPDVNGPAAAGPP